MLRGIATFWGTVLLPDGRRDFFLRSRFARHESEEPCTGSSPYLLLLFVLFHSCCSHARVFGKTLMHEFYISYSHVLNASAFFSRDTRFESPQQLPWRAGTNGLAGLIRPASQRFPTPDFDWVRLIK